jgi:glycosyltransferase involved in cell wall biosynthesis
MFSIIIPTFNNLDYLKICLDSLKKNSTLENEVIIHVNDGSDGTLDYLSSNNYLYTFSKENLGVCSAVNLAASKSKTNYLLYAHDDMYFLPDWDVILKKELLNCKDNFFYLSGTMMGPDGLIKLDCGSTHQNFD